MERFLDTSGHLSLYSYAILFYSNSVVLMLQPCKYLLQICSQQPASKAAQLSEDVLETPFLEYAISESLPNPLLRNQIHLWLKPKNQFLAYSLFLHCNKHQAHQRGVILLL